MSTLARAWDTSAALYQPTVNASGADARLRKQLADAKRDQRQAASSAQSLAMTALARVLEECANPGWDGYEALPISVKVTGRAEAFLDALPSSLTSPDIVPEPDGEIAVHWDFGRSLQLAISIGQSGPLHFAGVMGEESGQRRVRHGTEPFEGFVAGDLLRYIHEVHERAGAANHRRLPIE